MHGWWQHPCLFFFCWAQWIGGTGLWFSLSGRAPMNRGWGLDVGSLFSLFGAGLNPLAGRRHLCEGHGSQRTLLHLLIILAHAYPCSLGQPGPWPISVTFVPPSLESPPFSPQGAEERCLEVCWPSWVRILEVLRPSRLCPELCVWGRPVARSLTQF